jgi:hypothetical protein
MKTTTFSFGILLAAILVVVALSSPVQGRDAAAGPQGNRPLHAPEGQICEDATVLLGPMPYSLYGGTEGRGDDYNLGAVGACAGGGVQSEGTGLGEDHVFVFSTDMDCPIAIRMMPQGPYNLALYVLSTKLQQCRGQLPVG